MAQDTKPEPWQRTLETLDPDVLMSKDEAESVTDDIAGGLRQIEEITSELALKIADAKDRGAWKVLGYDSWGAYVDEAIGTTRRHADRLAKYGRMVESLLEASGWTVGPIEVQRALPENVFRGVPEKIAAELPAAVADAVKGKRSKNRAVAATDAIASARPDSKPEDTIEVVPDQALPGDEPVGDESATAQEPPDAAEGGDRAANAAMDLIAVTSVETLRAGGFARVRDMVDRGAQADGRILITVDQFEQFRKAMRENAEHKMDAPTGSPPSTRVRRPQVVARPQPLHREIVEPNFKGSKK